jgi:hypothetical protein
MLGYLLAYSSKNLFVILGLFFLLLALVSAATDGAIFSVRGDPSQGVGDRLLDGSQSITFRNVAVNTVLANCDTIDFRHHRQILVRVVSGAVTSLTPYVEGEPNGSAFEIIKDKTGTQIGPVTVEATGWFVIDENLFPAGAVRFVSDVNGTIDVCLKG